MHIHSFIHFMQIVSTATIAFALITTIPMLVMRLRRGEVAFVCHYAPIVVGFILLLAGQLLPGGLDNGIADLLRMAGGVSYSSAVYVLLSGNNATSLLFDTQMFSYKV